MRTLRPQSCAAVRSYPQTTGCRRGGDPDSLADMEVPTPHGRARVHLREQSDPVGLLMLGHGAGGGVGAPDLVAAADAAAAAGLTVALVEQPYRVAGRRNVAPTAQLDAAWIAVADALHE